jgi:uncharacterized protein YyaL (SSP411 family)
MANRLSTATSPYLRQHADNPVDWYPWGPEAFAKAKAENKPIFLSIGYSTCHWCHVMARESFENEAIAELLNDRFVAIKVDREERPDVDRVYMGYVQALTGHGGWPLSAFLTPELKPFYGGTYFPPDDRQGRTGFASLLRSLADGWRDDRAKLEADSERVLDALRQSKPTAPVALGSDGALSTIIFEHAGGAFEKGFHYFYQGFDREYGGFGDAPKFPRASNLSFLLRCAALQGPAGALGQEAIGLCGFTLQRMAGGGIHDHVGGGFHRYAVDRSWFVPHFEKMLYDQAQIAINALDTWQATGDERMAWLARDIFDYVLRDLTSPQGGFYSAEDADSVLPNGEHAEGAFYVWTQAEIEAALPSDQAELICRHFNVKPEGNVPQDSDPFQEFGGKNILIQKATLRDTALAVGCGLQEASDNLVAGLERLRAVRALRNRPGLDDKVLAAWNGLMISALARGAAVPAEGLADKREFLLNAAVKAAEFLRAELWDDDAKVLYRSWRGARGDAAGFAEDYACVVQGGLDLYGATFDLRWLQWADELQTLMDARFGDEGGGGYFNSAGDAPDIILRLKDDYDGAEPAPSSVAVMNLLRLDAILGGSETSGMSPRRVRALRTFEAFRARWSEYPQAMPQMLCAIELALDAPRHVVLAGNPASPDFKLLADALNEKMGYFRAVVAADGGPAQAWLAERSPWLAELRPRDGKATAYVCENYACQAPITSAAELRRVLAASVASERE